MIPRNETLGLWDYPTYYYYSPIPPTTVIRPSVAGVMMPFCALMYSVTAEDRDGSLLSVDGNWHDISVKLSDMKEHGAWINATQKRYEPEGKFSWNNITGLRFTAEEMAINGAIWLDDIQVVK